jgi:hypothetical protein
MMEVIDLTESDEKVDTQHETDHSERDIEKPYDSILSEALPVTVLPVVRGSVTSPNSNRAVVCCTITETTEGDDQFYWKESESDCESDVESLVSVPGAQIPGKEKVKNDEIIAAGLLEGNLEVHMDTDTSASLPRSSGLSPVIIVAEEIEDSSAVSSAGKCVVTTSDPVATALLVAMHDIQNNNGVIRVGTIAVSIVASAIGTRVEGVNDAILRRGHVPAPAAVATTADANTVAAATSATAAAGVIAKLGNTTTACTIETIVTQTVASAAQVAVRTAKGAGPLGAAIAANSLSDVIRVVGTQFTAAADRSRTVAIQSVLAAKKAFSAPAPAPVSAPAVSHTSTNGGGTSCGAVAALGKERAVRSITSSSTASAANGGSSFDGIAVAKTCFKAGFDAARTYTLVLSESESESPAAGCGTDNAVRVDAATEASISTAVTMYSNGSVDAACTALVIATVAALAGANAGATVTATIGRRPNKEAKGLACFVAAITAAVDAVGMAVEKVVREQVHSATTSASTSASANASASTSATVYFPGTTLGMAARRKDSIASNSDSDVGSGTHRITVANRSTTSASGLSPVKMTTAMTTTTTTLSVCSSGDSTPTLGKRARSSGIP